MGEYLPIGERLRDQRVSLGMNQTDFAVAAGVSRKTLFGYETGERAPDAAALAAWGKLGLDVLYVVTGQRLAQPVAIHDTKTGGGALKVTGQSNAATSPHLTETANPVTNELGPTEIDEALMRRIVTMLAKTAKAAGRRWEGERLMLTAVDVYKFLAKEDKVDDDKLERVLKLVVNR